MTAANRPKRVVVVDADNPLVEIQGEFFWREDHDVLVAAARNEGFRAGYRQGWADAGTKAAPPTQLVLRRRPTLLHRVSRIALRLMVAVMLLIVLATIAGQLLNQR